MLWTMRKKIMTLAISGLSLAAAGVVMYLMFPAIMKDQIRKRMILNENSESYKFWKEAPVPIYLEFYLFNLTNPDEVWDLTNKPDLEQLGPYTFRETREKVNITWNKENGTVTYREIKRWYFQSDRTNGSLDDFVTTLNVPMMAAAAKGKEMNAKFVYFALNEIFSSLNCSWFVRKKVRELLFEGYSDKLMDLARSFIDIPYDKFGWFYKRNGTDDGLFNVYTGEEDIETVDQINTWNHLRLVPSYTPPCSMINGSAGDMWPPDSANDEITMFVPDICRSLSFKYLKETTDKSINAYRFWADDTQLDNGKYNPENKCFCSEDNCLPAGGLNVSACKFEAPAVVSYPHFLFADPVYSDGVIGMRPNPQKHMMYLDVVPELGIPVGVAARMQINIVFENIAHIVQFENITGRIYFPVLWFSETAEATDLIVNQIKLILNTLPLVANIISFIFITIGFFLVLTALVLSIMYALGMHETAYSAVVAES